MKRKKQPGAVDLDAFDRAPPYQRNRMLLEWLADEERRGELFRSVNRQRHGVLPFPSLARDAELPTRVPRPPDTRPATAYLITRRDHIERALRTTSEFSNSPYAELGTGSFMLAIDPDDPDPIPAERRKLQMAAARRAFDLTDGQIGQLCEYAFHAAMPTALGASEFDLALLAEEAALRFCSALFGFASGDYRLLEDALRKGYQALNHLILGRHFVSNPLALIEAKMALGALLARAATLIDEYRLDDPERPDDVEGQGAGLPNFQSVMRALAFDTSDLTGEERAVLVVGSLVGIVGNVQASVCIALQSMLAHRDVDPDRDLVAEARRITLEDRSGKSLWPWLAEGLRLNPPVAFLPRRARVGVDLKGVPFDIEADAYCILAIGGATSDAAPASYAAPPQGVADPLLFGLDTSVSGPGVHWCLGKRLAEPLVQRICAGVLRLPSLAEQLDPVDGLPVGLEKQWGFRCVSYRLRHRRDLRFVQQPLNVVMRIRTPTAANAQSLRGVIRYGASRIEAVLRDSRHVHFAWFEFIDNDSKLVLHTVFDGDFGAYLQHFALVVGDVFDRLFEYIEDAPPRPVCDFPNEFVATIRRFHQPAAMGFFFSAYPTTDAAQIVRASRSRA